MPLNSRFSRPAKLLLLRRPLRRIVSVPALLGAVLLLATVQAQIIIPRQTMLDVRARYGVPAYERVKAWVALSKKIKSYPELRKLQIVNDFFNRLEFVSDEEHWHKQDYWATPLEMLVTNGGDCEDFSVAKYFTLREAGVPMKRLRLTYVKALKLNQAHMVLSYFPPGKAVPLVLDNLIPQIKLATERPDLVPVYSFNGEDLWLAKNRSRGKWVGKSSRISLWKQLVQRFNQQLKAPVSKTPAVAAGTGDSRRHQ